jgi:uncharacterized protein (TIGR00661 family)
MENKKLNFMFFVQGEGRGHLSQAISMKNIIELKGHVLNSVIVGSSKSRKIPDFFYERINVKVENLQSPNFAPDNKLKSINIFKTILINILLLPVFIKSLIKIRKILKEQKPDVIINFYEPLVGIYNLIFNNKIPVISIAHQYIFNHPDFIFPEGFNTERKVLKFFTNLTAIGSIKKLALSFYPLKSENNKLQIVPPIIRNEIFEMTTTTEDFILVYLVNAGYLDEIIMWHNENKNVVLHCFSDSNRIKEDDFIYDDTLILHKLNDKKFLELMSKCKGLVTTAGFDIVCEAMYFGKPLLMIPVEGHFEQFSNSRDSSRVGAGIYDTSFNISKLIEYIPKYDSNKNDYRKWIQSANYIVFNEIESAVIL